MKLKVLWILRFSFLYHAGLGFKEEQTKITIPEFSLKSSEEFRDNNILNEAEDENQDVCDCGKENIPESGRIIGGKEVDPPHRYPWMVVVMDEVNSTAYYLCGGILINHQYVLTAAHCVEPENDIAKIKVAIGIHDIHRKGHVARASEVKIHENYDQQASYKDDIAVIKLDHPVKFSAKMRNICLPTKEDFVSKSNVAITAGWGLKTTNTISRFLRCIELPLSEQKTCENAHPGEIRETNICAGGETGKDSCKGDSGGPLFTNHEERWYAIGITSWGFKCGVEDKPGVYTRVSKYLDWLQQKIEDYPSCQSQGA